MKDKLTPKDLRIGNYVEWVFPNKPPYKSRKEWITDTEICKIESISDGLIGVRGSVYDYCQVRPIEITEQWLIDLGFTAVENNMYINGKQWLMQVSNDYVDHEKGNIINEDGTWLDAIGTHSYREDGAMAINVLCRGNYVCGFAKHIHQLQNLFYDLTNGKELEFKKAKEGKQ